MRKISLVLVLPLALLVSGWTFDGQQAAAQKKRKFANRFSNYPLAKPAVGDKAPDFVLKDLDGKELRLSDWFGKMPVVIEFGSYT